MKRAAAAALALSVALSAAAPAALAKDYYIDDGDITVTVTEDGDTYVRVGEAKDKDDIGEKDDTDVVIKGGKNPDKQTENNSDGSADEVGRGRKTEAGGGCRAGRACGEYRHRARRLAR